MSWFAGLSGFGGGYAEGAQQAQQRRMQALALANQQNQLEGQEIAMRALGNLGDLGDLGTFGPQTTAGANIGVPPTQPTQGGPLGGVGPPTSFADRFNAAGSLPQPPTMPQPGPAGAGPAPGGSMLPGGERIMGPAPDPRQQAQTQLAVGLRAQEQRAAQAQAAQGAQEQQQVQNRARLGLDPMAFMKNQLELTKRIAQKIEQSNPNASPQAKFQAFKLLWQSVGGGQMNSQLMQMMQMAQSREFHEDTMAERRKADVRAEDAAARATERIDPIYQRYRKSTTDLDFKSTQTKTFTASMEKHVEQLAALAEKAGVTGQMDLDGFFNMVAAKFGSEVANQYRVQYAETAAELGRLISGGMGNAALTEGVRGEAHSVLPEGKVIPAKVLRAIGRTMKANAEARYKTYQDEIKDYDRRYKSYKETGTYEYSQTELGGEPTATAPATINPNDPLGFGTR